MTEGDHIETKPIPDAGPTVNTGDEPMGEEEKLLAGRLDVNMPALLTQDVHGG